MTPLMPSRKNEFLSLRPVRLFICLVKAAGGWQPTLTRSTSGKIFVMSFSVADARCYRLQGTRNSQGWCLMFGLAGGLDQTLEYGKPLFVENDYHSYREATRVSEWFLGATRLLYDERLPLVPKDSFTPESLALLVEKHVLPGQTVAEFRQVCLKVQTLVMRSDAEVLEGEEEASKDLPEGEEDCGVTEGAKEEDPEEPEAEGLVFEVSLDEDPEEEPTPEEESTSPPSEYHLTVYQGGRGPYLRLRAGGLNLLLKTPETLIRSLRDGETKKFGWMEGLVLLSFEVVGEEVVWQMTTDAGVCETRTCYGPDFEKLLADISSVEYF